MLPASEKVIDEYVEEAGATGEVSPAGANRAARHHLNEQQRQRIAAQRMPPSPVKRHGGLVIDSLRPFQIHPIFSIAIRAGAPMMAGK